ncbi:MAG TPA: SGNH/GDSL hydrolase family protein [Bryobacteraceae bacterium]|jgi:acyl-CoA thioesterase-1|nr:SGNH/GDSL hydrolase family protein [Bryobacteraceae bacterium]
MRFALWSLMALASTVLLPAQEKPNPAFAEAQDVEGLPHVMLIGDSISIGYTLPVRELLKGKANVHRIQTNGGPTINGLPRLEQWLGAGRWDVIHFNFGLHDLKIMEGGKRQVPLEQYESNLREIVQRLKATGAKLIWATTTPVPEGPVNPPRERADVAAYNRAAKKVMDEAGVAVDDLYAFVLPRESELQLPHNVHFTEAGYRALAGQVAASIEKALK